MEVLCPICKRTVLWSEANPYRPFCSERCKYQDLTAWATEQYRADAPIVTDDQPHQITEDQDESISL